MTDKKTKPRPSFLKEEHLKFLDGHKKTSTKFNICSGEVGSALASKFPELTKEKDFINKIWAIINYWRDTFGERHK